MSLSRRLLLQLTGSHVVAPALRAAGRGLLSIFMLHRFTDPHLGVVGTDPAALRDHLAYLRRHRYRLLGMTDVLARLADGDAGPAAPAVAFTVDDGYADFARIAAPVFAEYDCPVTLFVATGFLDGQLWFWWDRVTHLFEQTRRSSLAVGRASAGLYRWATPGERVRVRQDVSRRLEWLDAPEREATILDLSRQLDVELPATPPPAFAPMTWTDVRRTAAVGATFGPHTVTHRILSQAPSDAAEREIQESYRRVRQETEAAVPVFCYPNGEARSFGRRELEAVQRAGLRAAVSAVPGYAALSGPPGRGTLAPFALPRFPYPVDRPHLVHLASGLARLTQRLRPSRSGM